MASLKLSNANQSNQAVRPSFKARAAALKALAARVVRSEPTSPKPQIEPDLVDWHSPPLGFMAYPAIDPQAFINIPEGLRLELERLHDIACGEFERRAEAAGKNLHETMRGEIEDGLRRRLRLDGIEAALCLEPAIPASCTSDPILAAIQETERLQYAVDAMSKLPQPPGMIEPLPEQKAAFDAFYGYVDNVLLRTVPATAAGCAALARFVASYPRDRGFSLDDDEDGQHVRILDLIARSPMNRCTAAPKDETTPNWPQIQAAAVDLSGCSIPSLGRLFEAFSRMADTWSDMSCLPFAQKDEAASRLLDEEYQRAALIRDRIVSLICSRRSKDDSDRDETLIVRLLHELLCEGKVHDQALLADINAAWRA